MRSILLVNSSDSFDNVPLYPIGLDYLTSSLAGSDLEVGCLDLALRDPSSRIDTLCKTLLQRNWDIVGFNLRNVCDQTSREIRYIPALKKLVDVVRSTCKTAKHRPVVVVGGTGANLLPNTIMKETGADVVITGDGEAGFHELLAAMDMGSVNGKVIHTLTNIDSISYKRGAWGDVKEYVRLGADGNLQTKRGCARKCAYCAYPVIEGHEVRLRDPSLVAKEFIALERLGFWKIFIVDTVFNDPLPYAKRVLRQLQSAGTRSEWTAFFNPKFIDAELLELVKATNGGRHLKLTIESGSDAVLAALHKDFRQQHIVDAATLCHEANIPFSFTVLFGGPGENASTIAETCRLIKELKPQYVSASIGVYIYPNTRLAKDTKGELWQSEDELLGNVIYPVDRAKVKEQVATLLAGAPFPVYIH